MTAITEADHTAMSWHARQKLNDRLRAETQTLRAELAQLRADRTALKHYLARRTREADQAHVIETIAAAKSLLATLHDPDAAEHRLAAHRERHPREDHP